LPVVCACSLLPKFHTGWPDSSIVQALLSKAHQLSMMTWVIPQGRHPASLPRPSFFRGQRCYVMSIERRETDILARTPAASIPKQRSPRTVLDDLVKLC
jgi:hypothetical protein